jgi:hypothetical protein
LKLDREIADSVYLNPYQPLAASFRLNSNERSSYGAYSNLYEPLKRNWKSLSFGYQIPPNKYVGEVCTFNDPDFISGTHQRENVQFANDEKYRSV